MALFRLFGPPNVEKLRSKRDLDGLGKALRLEKNAALRRAAAEALGQIGEELATVLLSAVRVDPDPYVRVSAANALRSVAESTDLAELITILQNDTSVAARLVQYSLSESPDSDANDLVESVAAEIRRLYSRTVRYSVEERAYSASGVYVSTVEHEEPAPDFESIKYLISLIPPKLRTRVIALSGDAKSLF